MAIGTNINEVLNKNVNTVISAECDDDQVTTQKVSLYGWDPVSLAKVKVALSSDGSVIVGDKREYKYMDWASDTVLYTGWTQTPGQLTTAAVWSIRKRTFDANGGWTEEYAGNADTYVNKWSDRLTLLP